MHELLEYEASILLDIHNKNSLLVMADGLGMDTIVFSTLKLHSDPHNLLLVSNYRLSEARFFIELLTHNDVLHAPGIITSEVSNKDREAIYKRGGVVFVSSRILVVDLLMRRMPVELVTGVLILRVHELHEACQEDFAIRLLREQNPSIFIKAFTDSPSSITSGYNHAERIMNQFGLPSLVLWPRFNVQVMQCLSVTQPNVEEIRVQLTTAMTTCQSCILDLIKACLKELADRNPILKNDDLSLENALLSNFDGLLSLYLDPLWHQLPSSTRNLIGDIGSLRRLLRQLIDSDAVSFLATLEAHRQAAMSSLGGGHSSLPGGERRSGGGFGCPAWFLMDQADRLLVVARERVYSDVACRKLKVEVCPKWSSLVNILKELNEAALDKQTKQTSPSSGAEVKKRDVLLVLVGNERTAFLLERFLHRGQRSFARLLRYSLTSDTCQQPGRTTAQTTRQKDASAPPPQSCTLTQIYRPGVPDSIPVQDDESSSSTSSDSEQHLLPAASESGDGVSVTGSITDRLPLGCRRVSVRPKLLQGHRGGGGGGGNTFKNCFDLIIRFPPRASDVVNDASQRGSTSGGGGGGEQDNAKTRAPDLTETYRQRLAYVLDALQPRVVVLYEPCVNWVREVEVYQARRHAAAASSSTDSGDGEGASVAPLDVVFMLYANSVEEQRYLTTLRREKEAFESLIQLSSRVVLLKDAPVSGLVNPDDKEQPSVFVDMREFRSELPALLHRKGLKVEPITLSIGDYILAPHLCVERKSVSDLIGSLNSGRLYQQCTAMSRHYPNPILLIEFSLPTKAPAVGSVSRYAAAAPQKGFSLYTGKHSLSAGSSSASGGEVGSRHLLSRLCLLTIHFPSLRLVWSVSPYCTAELFAELKQGRAEPSRDKLPQDGEHLEDHNVEAVDVLLKLPGVSWKNYRRLMNRVNCLLDLTKSTLEQLIEILDSRENATKLYNFLHANFKASEDRETPCDPSTSSEGAGSSTSRGKRRGTSLRGPRFSLVGRVKTRRRGSDR